jgi:hypothetical protein
MDLIGDGYSREHPAIKKGVGITSMRANGMAFVRSSRSVAMPYDPHNSIILVSPSGDVSCEIGSGRKGFSSGTDVTKILMSHPCGVACDNRRDVLFVADTGNHIIREFPKGRIAGRIVGRPTEGGHRDGDAHNGMFMLPTDISASMDYLYVVDGDGRIRRMDMEKLSVETIYVGRGIIEAVTCDERGDLYFTEIEYAP